jgi:enediyne biosynthesis protein E4
MLIACCYLFALAACNSHSNDTLFRKVSASSSGITFKNELTYSDNLSVLEFEYMFNGSGVALLDVNNDGLQDVMFGGNMISSRLYLNKGKLKFEDITKKAGIETSGWVYGISVVDINQDGFDDIYICKAGSRKTQPAEMKNLFFINNGNGTFSEKATSMELDDDGYDIHAAFLDYDKDGDLDMYLLRNAFVNYNRNTARLKNIDGGAPSTDRLYRNDGNMHFTNVSNEAGIRVEGFGLGVTVCDLNEDNWPDLYVSNDFLTNDLIWINNCDGTFSNKAGEYLRHQTYNGMGNDVADYNNDGHEDIMVVDMLPPDNKRWKLTMRGNSYEEFQNALSFGYEPQYVRNTLQLNNGDGTFSEIGQLAGVHATEWSWAPLFADFDNDGDKDLFVSNGYRQDITNLDFIRYGKNALFVGTPEANRIERLKELKKYPGIRVHNYVFENNRDLTFKDVSEKWGMDDPSYSNGAAYGDLDNDGDLDVVVNNLDQEASLYENRSTEINKNAGWLRIGLKGSEGNRSGIGARVVVWQKGNQQVSYCSPYRGYLSSVEKFVHFGLSNEPVDSLKVLWLDGKVQLMKNVKQNQLLWLNIADAIEEKTTSKIKNNSLFSPVANNGGIGFKHEEDKFVDFKTQPLLPRMLSHEGPGLAVGDIDNDGLNDLFTGAASGFNAAIFCQKKDGTFARHELPFTNAADNMGALFVDADNDGDADLYVAAGGSSVVKKDDTTYRHRLLLNDGKGNFDKEMQLPNVNTSASSVAAADFDHDGDLDLFVAGRLNPGKYPSSPRSYLLRNDKTLFTDISGEELSNPGMVTTALWTDFDNDGWVDLIVAGEFMPVKFFKNHSGQLKDYTNESGLQHTNGWWNSIVSADFDKDGDIDYVLGNLGLNSPLKASKEEPVCVYANDYDKDGRLDPVLCHYIEGVEYVVASRDDMNRQMTSMRGRFRTYEAYADVNFRNTFRHDEIAAATVLKSERFESSYIENMGGGKFEMRSLPSKAQFSPIYGMLAGDFNGDGNIDVLAVGNSFSTEVQTGRYDAQGSLLLAGDGHSQFSVVSSPMYLKGDNKSIVEMHSGDGKPLFVVGVNADSIRVFTRHNTSPKKINLEPYDQYAIIKEKNGKSYRQEFYHGSTYLSQSERALAIPGSIQFVEIFNSKGSKRTINF